MHRVDSVVRRVFMELHLFFFPRREATPGDLGRRVARVACRESQLRWSQRPSRAHMHTNTHARTCACACTACVHRRMPTRRHADTHTTAPAQECSDERVGANSGSRSVHLRPRLVRRTVQTSALEKIACPAPCRSGLDLSSQVAAGSSTWRPQELDLEAAGARRRSWSSISLEPDLDAGAVQPA